MKPPRESPPVCCESHTRRYMPIPETPEEEAAVAAALARWGDDWYVGEDENGTPIYRRCQDDAWLPPYVAMLLPA